MLSRSEQELDILEKISQILGDGLDYGEVFQRVMTLLGERMGILQASLVLWDDASDVLRIVAAVGMTKEEIARGRYAMGEGVVGQVLASGKAQTIADINKHPQFLNRTRSRQLVAVGAGGGLWGWVWSY